MGLVKTFNDHLFNKPEDFFELYNCLNDIPTAYSQIESENKFKLDMNSFNEQMRPNTQINTNYNESSDYI